MRRDTSDCGTMATLQVSRSHLRYLPHPQCAYIVGSSVSHFAAIMGSPPFLLGFKVVLQPRVVVITIQHPTSSGIGRTNACLYDAVPLLLHGIWAFNLALGM